MNISLQNNGGGNNNETTVPSMMIMQFLRHYPGVDVDRE
jgi:hypothetical protein